MQIGLIKYTAKMYEINANDFNVTRLAAIGPWDSIATGMLTLSSQILKATWALDIFPIVGSIVSFFANFATVKLFGNAIQKHFFNLITDEKIVIIIRDILKDYGAIYLQLRDDLGKREIFNIDQR